VSYCGYVCEDTEARQAQPNEELPGLSGVQPGERVVIACGGGGHDAFPMLSATMDALERLDGDPSLRSVVIAGPLMAPEKRAELADRASKLKRTTLLPRVADCLHYLARADVSVIMGGYNSSLEALSTSSRIIMVPRPGPSAEQTMRAELMADKGHLQYVPLAQAEPALLAEAIRSAAAAPARHKNSNMLDGAGRAARTILSHVRADHAPPASFPSSKEASPYVLF
jgi:predicted glycosyltransferase